MRSEIRCSAETDAPQAPLRECVSLRFHDCDTDVEVGRKPGELSGILRIPRDVTLCPTAVAVKKTRVAKVAGTAPPDPILRESGALGG